jgi:hypothetical protein
MSEYVEIRSSPAEIMSIANGLRGQGEALRGDVSGINGEIRERESRAETFPPDDFTNNFLKNYHQEAPGVDGTNTTANVAVRQSAAYCAGKLIQIGDFVGAAMMNYGATDDESGEDIAKTV